MRAGDLIGDFAFKLFRLGWERKVGVAAAVGVFTRGFAVAIGEGDAVAVGVFARGLASGVTGARSEEEGTVGVLLSLVRGFGDDELGCGRRDMEDYRAQ